MQFSVRSPRFDLLVSNLQAVMNSFAEKPQIDREPIRRLQHAMNVPWAGVQVVAFVPVAGPVPPPISVVSPFASASVMICGQIKWICVSIRRRL